MKARNMFILLKITFNLSLVFSLYVNFLGLIFTNNTFLALSLTSAARISELDILLRYNQLPLHLKPEIADIFVFRKSVRTLYN
jgi:hypothetical protein